MKKLISFLTIALFLFSLTPALAVHDAEIPESEVESIVLEGVGNVVEWSVEGYSAKGYKVVWSKNEHPVYPLRDGDKYHYYTDPEKNSDELTAFSGNGTYHVRVCEYLGGACGLYSNEITVELGGSEINNSSCTDTDGDNSYTKGKVYGTMDSESYKKYDYCDGDHLVEYMCAEDEHISENHLCEHGCLDGYCKKEETSSTAEVEKITLTDKGDNMVKWVTEGYSAKGFKVVWSKNAHPTYPTREGDKYYYFSNPDYYYTTLTAFSGGGEYYVRVCEYLGSECGTYSNEIAVSLTGNEPVACTMEYDPVCGVDGKTYGNKCTLNAAGVAKKHYGECAKDDDIKEIEEKASQLNNDQMDDILAELQALRNIVKEQQNEIAYLTELLKGVVAVTKEMQTSINNFITYGVDENTEKLGEGERAAVMHSYKSAFGKLPENDQDMADAIKIANGRWPSQTSDEAETSAKANFEFVYQREANMDDAEDNAAVTVMAYGLRQKAHNRNLEAEKNSIRIFQALYGRLPTTTEDWNIMQAIAYSGASR